MLELPVAIQADELDSKIENYELFESYEDAQQFMKYFERGLTPKRLVFYTQVEEDGKRVYLKGKHIVNRTGIYLVAWKW